MSIDLKDILAEDFQLAADSALIRNRGLMDNLSKLGTSSARLSRAITKAHTHCGCIDMSEKKLQGDLCEKCRGVIEQEMGDLLFYTAGLCNTLGLSIYDVMLKEKQALGLLANFSLK
ncbi:MAG: DUF1573 domain-containing protein [Christensenellaceae bacterium]|nr:DUF1573 domain-containing protein [Christensenellaceae bacterium]